jgi:thiol-disulfide isomerase/thioredoxin
MRRSALWVGLFALSGCLQREVLPPVAGPIQAVAAEPLALSVPRYPGGEPFELASERGHVVLLDVWATWCEPCVEALPMYAALQKQYADRGLKVYALNVDDDESELPGFLSRHGVTLPVLRDPGVVVSERLLKVRMMPTSFLVDRAGVVRHVHEGFAEEFLPRYQQEIEQLLAEPAKGR